jgi:hypothetical protein
MSTAPENSNIFTNEIKQISSKAHSELYRHFVAKLKRSPAEHLRQEEKKIVEKNSRSSKKYI